MAKKALVLSGGSIKGAFQVGAAKAVLETGFAPDIITGISVGSVNGAYIANAAGVYRGIGKAPDWKQIGIDLYRFWEEHIHTGDDIVKKRNPVAIAEQVLTKHFKGFTDSTPIYNLIDEYVSADNMVAGGIDLAVGTVNMADGKIYYVSPDAPEFLEYVKGSMAIPFVMDAVDIGGHPYLDGGLRDSAPLKTAIKKGATEIIAVLCHSKNLAGTEFNGGNVMDLAERIMDVHINETVNTDLEWAIYANQFLPDDGSAKADEPFKGYRKLKITVIRPETEVLLNLSSFTEEELHEVMRSGYRTAKGILQP